MATTTNFGWETPDDTDLVKDGALAIRTLGSAIDTSLVDLKGGTTGQVLSKTSNTDMDFTWVTSDDANAIQNAIVDAKGDLIAASAADTPARLAVGNDGETLVADSSTSTGLRWSAGLSLSNPIINSAMDIAQRGTSISFTNNERKFSLDRWEASSTNGSGTVSRQATGDTTNLPNIQYCVRFQRTSGQTATGGNYLVQNFESNNSIPYAGKTITVSYYARKGADLSGTFAPWFGYGTGTDQNVYTGLTGQTTLNNTSVTLTTTWQRFSFSVSVPTTATQLAFYFVHSASGTAGTNDYFEATGIQVDVGSTALPFRRNGSTLAGELAACQRYFIMLDTPHLVGAFGSTTAANRLGTALPVEMRTEPSVSLSGTLGLYDGSTVGTITTLTGANHTKQYIEIDGTAATGTYAANRIALIIKNNTGKLSVSAEL